MDVPLIWVISPDPDTQRLIALNLKKRGFGVLEACLQDEPAPTGVEPQLIILDVDQPGESGWEAAGALRQGSGAQEVPMILLLPSAPSTRRLTPFQPVRWLEKPLDMDALLILVRQSLGE